MGSERALELGPDGIIAELRNAGLREKGGAGRPLAARWQAVREAGGTGTYVVCNAVDSDPHAPVARFVLEGKADAVLQGLLVAAFAVGAEHCVVCVNAEEIAGLEQAAGRLRREAGPDAGERGARRACAVRIEPIACSSVAGEETALIRALEHRQPLPFLRPEGDVSGVEGAPTLVESAETLAAVAALFAGDPAGVKTATKVISVFGDVPQPGTLEVPLGTTIAATVEQATGRAFADLHIKAVQFGGPAARFLTGEALNTPISHEDLRRVGAIMGSGGIGVFGDAWCAVEMAQHVTAYLHEQSCGKCVFCREGSRQLVDILSDVAAFRADAEKMELLGELARAMGTSSICSLGWGAALPVLSALELFPDDFAAHLEGKRCPGKTA